MGLLQRVRERLRDLDEWVLGDHHAHAPGTPRTEPASTVWRGLDRDSRERALEALHALEVPSDPDLALVVAGLADEWSEALEHTRWLRVALRARLTVGWIERLRDLRRACRAVAAGRHGGLPHRTAPEDPGGGGAPAGR